MGTDDHTYMTITGSHTTFNGHAHYILGFRLHINRQTITPLRSNHEIGKPVIDILKNACDITLAQNYLLCLLKWGWE